MNYADLTNAGMNVDEFLKRLMGKESLLNHFIASFLKDSNFSRLKTAILNNDTDNAIAASHALKGICGNMSINTLFDLFTAQVILLRNGEWDKAIAMMPEITAVYEKITAAFNKWLEQQTN